jgi:hypothetical protein
VEHEPAVALVAHQEVRPAAEHEHGQLGLGRGGERARHVLAVLRLEEVVRRAADLQRGVAAHRLVEEQLGRAQAFLEEPSRRRLGQAHTPTML